MSADNYILIKEDNMKQHYERNNKCIDCGKLITNNATKCGSCARKGRKFSKESRRKISNALKGRKLSEETKKKISKNSPKFWSGKKYSKEHKEKISKAMKGKNNPMYGKKLSKKTQEKMSKSHKGKKLSKEHKSRISKARKGKNRLEETKRKISETQKGKRITKKHRRKMSEAHKGQTPWNRGKKLSEKYRRKLSLSKGGTGIPYENSEYPKEFNKELKEKIRKRDNYICQNCGITQKEHLIIYNREIEVHHINYNRQNCKEDNLITFCKSCNIRVNYSRRYWKQYLSSKLMINKIKKAQSYGAKYGYKFLNLEE